MIDPRTMSLTDWCDSMTFELEVDGSVPRLDGLDWQDWGIQVLRLLVPNQQDAPSPYQFSDWREFATRLQLYLGGNS